MSRRWFLLLIPLIFLLWLFNVSRSAAKVEGCFQDCAGSEDNSKKELVIVSLNMLHGYPKFEHLSQRLEIIADEIIQLGVDIILLQEVPWTIKTGNGAKVIADKAGLNYVFLRANGNRWAIGFEEGEAILSRYPLTNIDFIELKPRPGFFEHRVVLKASIETGLGAVDLYVSHLTNGDPNINFGQAETLLEFVESSVDGIGIIAGDFNAAPESPQIQLITSRLVDTFDPSGNNGDGYTCCIHDLTQKTNNLNKRIDYIFMMQGDNSILFDNTQRVFAQPVPINGGWLWASDHIGLKTTIKLIPK